MKNAKRYRQYPAAIGALVVSAGLAYGQAAAPSTPAASSTPSNEDEQIVVLSPFEVSASSDTGYEATQTLAGTRIRTNLADVGGAIQVVTKAFLEDTGATDNGTLFQYTTNTEVAGTRGTYGGMGNSTDVDESGNLIAPAGAQRVRGLAAADNALNYFITDIPWDSYNVDRIDILRGPNSILYGLGSPAGIVNATLRDAGYKTTGSVQARIGSYGTWRTSLDYNQVLVPNTLSVRVDALQDDKKYEQDPAYENQRRIYGTVRFDPKLFDSDHFRTNIKVRFEAGDISSNHPRTVPPMDSISAWYRPNELSASNPFGGMGKAVIGTVYDANRTDTDGIAAGYGQDRSTTPNFQPWLAGSQVQQPYYFIDGATNRLDKAFAGFINNGWRDSAGVNHGVASGDAGLLQFVPLYSINSFSQAVLRYHNLSGDNFADSKYGQYRSISMSDPSIFDFYNKLIDGPNKHEYDRWSAFNFDLVQTAFDGRLGIDLTYDHQRDKKGGESLLGWQPQLSIDLTQNTQDYYVNPSSTGITNPNFLRPFVLGAGGNGGTEYTYERKAWRASLFGELRSSDFTRSDFLQKLLGKQRFNAVYANDEYSNEKRTFQLYADSKGFSGYWNGNDGSTALWYDRPPQAVIYLGPAVDSSASSAAGLNIPNIQSTVTLPDTGVRLFDSTWTNPAGVGYNDPWTVPGGMQRVFSPVGGPNYVTDPAGDPYTGYTQSNNLANYVGWRDFTNNLLRYDNGADQTLVRTASKGRRETTSYSGSYQGYFWNDAVIATLGWRYDEVKSKSVIAGSMAANRSVLNLDPNVYALPDQYPDSGIYKGHSTSGGVVVHLNRLLPSDFLPIDVRFSYNKSNNFQVASARTDIYGNAIGNPSGRVKEYGLMLSTKDNKYSLRMVKYTNEVLNGTSTLSNSYILGQVVATGLTWRNIYLYQMGGYDWAGRNQGNYRNTWTNAYPLSPDANTPVYNLMYPNGIIYTQALADQDEDKMIDTWNTIQTDLAAKGFFKAWNFTPLDPTVLVNRSTYVAANPDLQNPTQYVPDPNTIGNYSAQSNTFAVTSDKASKGYEVELTANPTPNWRVSFNASKTTATENNVGGATLTEYINYLNSKLTNADGSITPAGDLPRYGGEGNGIYASIWSSFLGNYQQLKLNEGSDVPELRKYRYNFITNYSFREGMLNGFGVGGAYHIQDKVVIGYPVLAGSTGTVPTFDLAHPYFGPSLNSMDLWASYEHKITEKVDWRIQLNVYNVGKKDKLIPISIEPDGKTWAAARIAPVQQWTITNTFSF